jgi:hypothetical protein
VKTLKALKALTALTVVTACTLTGAVRPAEAAPAVAFAASVANTPTASSTSAAEVPPVASESEKVRAARTLGVVPTDAMLLLRDKEFVIALWRQATGSEVRASAELAFAGTDLACTEWIKSGVVSANERDQQQQMRDAEAARVTREAKEQAAIVVGIVPEAELLIQNDRDFLFAVFGRVNGPRVRAAILAALGGTAAEQKELITNGLRTAHAGDQQDAINADQQTTEAEKARKAAEAARGRAVSVVRVIPTPDIVSLPDDDVLRVIADGARPGSEIEAAAVTALRSRVRADWKRFIDTGVYDANWRDVTAVLAQKAEADRALVDDIRHQAVVGGIRPRLAHAAERALAGGVDDVRAFLDQGQYDALTQSFSRNAINGNIAGQYLRETTDGVVVKPGAAEPVAGEGLDATWRIVAGLAGEDCFSLESPTKPNHYLARYFDGKKTQVGVRPADGTVDFGWNATWCVDNILPGAGVTLRGGADFLTRQSDGRAGVGIEFYWWVTEPLPDSTEITVNWLNKYLPDYDPYTDLLVSPLGPEQVDGAVRYRDFQRRTAPGQVAFRSYWSRGGAVHPLTTGRGSACASPEILAAYLRLGGHPALGVPVTDEACTSDKAGRFVNFAGGGSIYAIDRAGAHAVLGEIRAKWLSLGAEKSTLGYPTSDEVAIPGGRRGTFERGRIDYDTATGVATVYPAS